MDAVLPLLHDLAGSSVSFAKTESSASTAGSQNS
jgi:hypothetical protein